MEARSARLLLAAMALVVVLLLGQALSIAAAPPGPETGTGKAVGQAGFAYLGGLRTFAAAVLWNRIDPQYHEYYESGSFLDLDFMMPTIALVQWLNPQFEQSYYTASYFVSRKLSQEQGIEIARQGVENNPDSGLLTANLAQLLFIESPKGNLPETIKLATRGISSDVRWDDDESQFEGYAVFRDIFATAGNQELADSIDAVMQRMREQGVDAYVDPDDVRNRNEGR